MGGGSQRSSPMEQKPPATAHDPPPASASNASEVHSLDNNEKSKVITAEELAAVTAVFPEAPEAVVPANFPPSQFPPSQSAPFDEQSWVKSALEQARRPQAVISRRNVVDSPTSLSSQMKHEKKENSTVLRYLVDELGFKAESVHPFCGHQSDRKFLVPSPSSLLKLHKKASAATLEYNKRVFLAAYAAPWLLTETFQIAHRKGFFYSPRAKEKQYDLVPSELEVDYFAQIYEGSLKCEDIKALDDIEEPQEDIPEHSEAEKQAQLVKRYLDKALGVKERAKNNRESLEQDLNKRTVVMFEFGSNNDSRDAAYKLAQLEIRLAFWTAYQAAKGWTCVPFHKETAPDAANPDSPEASPPYGVSPASNEEDGKEVQVICGLVVPQTTHETIQELRNFLHHADSSLPMFRNCSKYKCMVLSSSKDHPSIEEHLNSSRFNSATVDWPPRVETATGEEIIHSIRVPQQCNAQDCKFEWWHPGQHRIKSEKWVLHVEVAQERTTTKMQGEIQIFFRLFEVDEDLKPMVTCEFDENAHSVVVKIPNPSRTRNKLLHIATRNPDPPPKPEKPKEEPQKSFSHLPMSPGRLKEGEKPHDCFRDD